MRTIDLEKKPSLKLACSFLVLICITFMLYIIYVVWASVILSRTTGAENACNQIWIYTLVNIILSVVSFGGLTISINININNVDNNDNNDILDIIRNNNSNQRNNQPDNKSNKTIKISTSLVAIGLLIWGAIIYSRIMHNHPCHSLYDHKYIQLWILFKVSFWFNVAASILILFIESIMCCCACCYLKKKIHVNTRLNSINL